MHVEKLIHCPRLMLITQTTLVLYIIVIHIHVHIYNTVIIYNINLILGLIQNVYQ